MIDVNLKVTKLISDKRSVLGGDASDIAFSLDVTREQYEKAKGYRIFLDWDGESDCLIRGRGIEIHGGNIAQALERWIVAVNRKDHAMKAEGELR